LPKGPIRRRVAADVAGLHLALNVLVATGLLWIVIRKWAGLNPIWAISAMLASSDPEVSVALKHFRSRLINAVLGCATGFLFLLLGGSRDWKLPLALAVTAFISSYIVRVPVIPRGSAAALQRNAEGENEAGLTSTSPYRRDRAGI